MAEEKGKDIFYFNVFGYNNGYSIIKQFDDDFS